jgi:hypothetical protein
VADLSPSDIRRIAAFAGGCCCETVVSYLCGVRRTQWEKREAIEDALRHLGMDEHIRPVERS